MTTTETIDKLSAESGIRPSGVDHLVLIGRRIVETAYPSADDRCVDYLTAQLMCRYLDVSMTDLDSVFADSNITEDMVDSVYQEGGYHIADGEGYVDPTYRLASR